MVPPVVDEPKIEQAPINKTVLSSELSDAEILQNKELLMRVREILAEKEMQEK